MVTKEHIFLISQLVEMNAGKSELRFSEDLKETYRFSIKHGKRREFVEKARLIARHFYGLSEKDLVEIFKQTGRSMVALAEILAEYHIFQKWLSKNIGEPL